MVMWTTFGVSWLNFESAVEDSLAKYTLDSESLKPTLQRRLVIKQFPKRDQSY
jgi:hypothetical protein